MKKHKRLIQIAKRYLARPALRYRRIWLPAASAAGVAFFILCDYIAHAMVACVVMFVWLYYALFLICRRSNIEVDRDEQGNIFIQHKKVTNQKSEKS